MAPGAPGAMASPPPRRPPPMAQNPPPPLPLTIPSLPPGPPGLHVGPPLPPGPRRARPHKTLTIPPEVGGPDRDPGGGGRGSGEAFVSERGPRGGGRHLSEPSPGVSRGPGERSLSPAVESPTRSG